MLRQDLLVAGATRIAAALLATLLCAPLATAQHVQRVEPFGIPDRATFDSRRGCFVAQCFVQDTWETFELHGTDCADCSTSSARDCSPTGERFSVAEVRFEHRQLDAILSLPAARSFLAAVDVGPHERLLVRRGGEPILTLGPGRHAFRNRARPTRLASTPRTRCCCA